MLRSEAIAAVSRAVSALVSTDAPMPSDDDFEHMFGVAERFPGYGPEVLYREACARAQHEPENWADLPEDGQMFYTGLRHLVTGIVPMIQEPEPAPAPETAAARNPGLERVSDDDDDDRPGARFNKFAPTEKEKELGAAVDAQRETIQALEQALEDAVDPEEHEKLKARLAVFEQAAADGATGDAAENKGEAEPKTVAKKKAAPQIK